MKGDIQDSFFKYIVNNYGEDIKNYFSGFDTENISGDIVYYVFCNEALAGFFIGKKNDDKIDVVIDYTVPSYRDCFVAKFLYITMKKEGFKQLGIKKPTEKHIAFLNKMNYEKKDNSYVKLLNEE